MPDPGSPTESSSDAPAQSIADRWIAPFVREPLLWPVTAVILAHGVAFLAPVLLLALRDRRTAPIAALTGIVLLTGAAVRSELERKRKPGIVCALLATVWGFAVLAAYAAHRTGIF
jgi:hypothetical protein